MTRIEVMEIIRAKRIPLELEEAMLATYDRGFEEGFAQLSKIVDKLTARRLDA